MKDSRIGECLWSMWEGEGYNPGFSSSIVYYTEGHVDLDHEVVKKALASSIQRDGIVYSLFEAFTSIDSGINSQGWVGSFSGEIYQEVCDQDGNTESGSSVDNLIPVTFVEVSSYV
jgi:hypothetical protein